MPNPPIALIKLTRVALAATFFTACLGPTDLSEQIKNVDSMAAAPAPMGIMVLADPSELAALNGVGKRPEFSAAEFHRQTMEQAFVPESTSRQYNPEVVLVSKACADPQSLKCIAYGLQRFMGMYPESVTQETLSELNRLYHKQHQALTTDLNSSAQYIAAKYGTAPRMEELREELGRLTLAHHTGKLDEMAVPYRSLSELSNNEPTMDDVAFLFGAIQDLSKLHAKILRADSNAELRALWDLVNITGFVIPFEAPVLAAASEAWRWLRLTAELAGELIPLGVTQSIKTGVGHMVYATRKSINTLGRIRVTWDQEVFHRLHMGLPIPFKLTLKPAAMGRGRFSDAYKRFAQEAQMASSRDDLIRIAETHNNPIAKGSYSIVVPRGNGTVIKIATDSRWDGQAARALETAVQGLKISAEMGYRVPAKVSKVTHYLMRASNGTQTPAASITMQEIISTGNPIYGAGRNPVLGAIHQAYHRGIHEALVEPLAKELSRRGFEPDLWPRNTIFAGNFKKYLQQVADLFSSTTNSLWYFKPTVESPLRNMGTSTGDRLLKNVQTFVSGGRLSAAEERWVVNQFGDRYWTNDAAEILLNVMTREVYVAPTNIPPTLFKELRDAWVIVDPVVP